MLGTLITTEAEDNMEQPIISGIAFNRDEAKLTILGVPDKPGIASKHPFNQLVMPILKWI